MVICYSEMRVAVISGKCEQFVRPGGHIARTVALIRADCCACMPLIGSRSNIFPSNLRYLDTSGYSIADSGTEFATTNSERVKRWRPIRLWNVEAPTFSREMAHRWRWGCQPYAPAALYPLGSFQVLISVRGWVDPRAIVWLEGLGELKNLVTSSGIKSVTFWLSA
jgi:hypothetical protein